MLATAESLVRRGSIDIEQLRWLDLQQGTYGLDGLLYSRKGIGLPLAMLPLTWLGLMLPDIGLVATSLLINPIITALTAVLLVIYLQQLGFEERIGLIVALTYGLTTLAWPYAKSLFSDPFSGLLLLTAAICLARLHPQRSAIAKNRAEVGLAFLAGTALAWNVATRYAEAIVLPLFGLYLLTQLVRRYGGWSQWRRFVLPCVSFALPIGVVGVLILAFNLTRYGHPLDTGYLPTETFSEIWWRGVSGQLFSPGRGLLLYSPIFCLSLVGLWASWRKFPAETLLALGIILSHLLLYGKWFMWHGGYAWGPRFLIPTLPFWAIFLAPIVAIMWSHKTRFGGSLKGKASLATPLYLLLAGFGFILQCLMVMVDFAPYQNALLDTGLPLFAPQTFFEWQYAPLIMAWSFINWHSVDVAWLWQGQLNGWLLMLLLVNVAVAGVRLIYLSLIGAEADEKRVVITSSNRRATDLSVVGGATAKAVALRQASCGSGNRNGFALSRTTFLQIGLTLLTVTALLTHTHNVPSDSLTAAVDHLNRVSRPTDAIILNEPTLTVPFAERYQGRATVLGLQSGGAPLSSEIERRLQQVITQHEQIWWLPNWLPPSESGVEQMLLSQTGKVMEQQFGEQRLVLFAASSDLPTQPLPDFDRLSQPTRPQFEEAITLVEVAYQPETTVGVAWSLDLHWQTTRPLTTSYHLFVHLLDESSGELVAQADGQPVNWLRPTTTWQIGETIVDRRALWLPTDLAAGAYQARVGWYDPSTGQRLMLVNGDDALMFRIYLTK